MIVLLPTVVGVQWVGHALDANVGATEWLDPASQDQGHDHQICVLLQDLLVTQAPVDVARDHPFDLAPTTAQPLAAASVFRSQVKHPATWPRGPPFSI